ncbi:MAG: mechanosensitive ion channel [Gammaproteobacteria bacterium]|jgi:small conductance mechanosensitive channel|nr:mechanosensitive ion channel [Gammaproteobacteria bacterium]
MKAALVRLMAGIWTVGLLTIVSTGVIAQSDTASQATSDELSTLHNRIEGNIADAKKLEKLVDEAKGDIRTMLEHRFEDKQFQIVDNVNALSVKIVEQEAAGNDMAQMRKIATDYLQRLMPAFRRQVEQQNKIMIDLISAKPPEDLRATISSEIAMNKAVTDLVGWYSAYHDSSMHLQTFGIDAATDKEYLTTKLPRLAELLADTITLTTEEIADTRLLLTLMPEDADFKTRLKLIDLRRDGAVANLSAVADLLEKLDIDSADYTSLVLRVSGDVSTGLLETGVWASLLQQWGENTWNWTTENSLDWILKLIILFIVLYAARALSRVTRRVVEQGIERVNLSQLLRRMIVATAANGVFVIGVLIALSQLGISVGPLLAGLGIAGIIIGFALQDTLSNFASGMMILIYRPYDVGDLIDAGGEFGTVTDMNLVSTVILTIDNQKLVLPNNLIWGGIIRNITAEKTRRVDMTFGISYDDDIPKAERILEDILATNEKVLEEPEPDVKLHTLGESSVDFVVRPWVRTDDYWNVYWDVTREVKMRFDAEGISIPFPQRDVHIYRADTEAPRTVSRRDVASNPVDSKSHGPDIEEAES